MIALHSTLTHPAQFHRLAVGDVPTEHDEVDEQRQHQFAYGNCSRLARGERGESPAVQPHVDRNDAGSDECGDMPAHESIVVPLDFRAELPMMSESGPITPSDDNFKEVAFVLCSRTHVMGPRGYGECPAH
jgi:hypothetical protein